MANTLNIYIYITINMKRYANRFITPTYVTDHVHIVLKIIKYKMINKKSSKTNVENYFCYIIIHCVTECFMSNEHTWINYDRICDGMRTN